MVISRKRCLGPSSISPQFQGGLVLNYLLPPSHPKRNLVWFFFNPYRSILFIMTFRERKSHGGEKYRCERETLISCLPYTSWLGIVPATFLVHGTMPQQTEPLAKVRILHFLKRRINMPFCPLEYLHHNYCRYFLFKII